jgi:hypothetical protein
MSALSVYKKDADSEFFSMQTVLTHSHRLKVQVKLQTRSSSIIDYFGSKWAYSLLELYLVITKELGIPHQVILALPGHI